MKGLLYIVILLAAAGCFRPGHADRGLDEAGALMHSDPAAALERLNGYDVAEFDDSATMARWALLYAEAMVANRLSAPTDTIVDIAIRYYGEHSHADEAQHAARLKTLLRHGDSDALASALYLQKEKEFLLYKERTKRRQTLLLCLLGLAVAGGIIARQRQRLRLHEARNEALVAEAADLRRGLSATLDGRFDVIDELCQTYYESQGTRSERKAIADKVKAQIEALRADDRLFADMERAVNDARGNLLNLLREELPGIKPDEYRLAVYLGGNLSSRTMALLLGESVDVVYKRKSRLKGRIAATDMPHRDRFMEIF